MTLTAEEVYRDFVTDGVPSSGKYKPSKKNIRTLLAGYERAINAFLSNGGKVYTSKASIDADLMQAAKTMAWVISDPVAANNGIYQKQGAAGAGSWMRIADLPYSFIVASDAGAGTPNAVVATSALPISGSALVLLNIAQANSATPVTVSFNGSDPVTIKSNSGNDIAPGGLVAGMLVLGRLTGSAFRLVTDQVSSAIIAQAEASAAAANSAKGAAEAAAASVSLPLISAGDAGKHLTVGSDLHYTLSPERIPAPGAADGGKVLIAKTDGTYLLQPSTVLDPDPIGRYQVAVNRTITAPDGSRFIVKGVQMFDYLFCGFEARSDYRYREAYPIAGRGSVSGVSNPTGYAKVCYVSAANVEAQIKLARMEGVNLIRVGVEPAVQLASLPYVDPGDGNTYPSDPQMLDTIIETAARYGMVVQLQQSNDDVPNAQNITFLKWLTGRYFKLPHVWINPSNEPLGATNGGADVNNVAAWTNRVAPLVTALREDIAGQPAGTKFLNPVCIDPPGWAERIDLITSQLASAPFSTDPNLIINVHVYGRAGDYDFRNARLAEVRSRWASYISNLCIVVGETGIDNLSGRLDPSLDAGVPSVDPTNWSNMQSFTQDFLRWVNVQLPYTSLNGVIGHMWYAYVPGLTRHDDNSMRKSDGTWTTWGSIYRAYFLKPALTDLAFYQQIAGLDLTKVSSGSLGTPLLQAEGKSGLRSAAAFVMQGSTDNYIGFHNRATNTTVGTIAGTSGGGTVYNTTSDERLKGGIRDPGEDEVIATFEAIRPRKGHYLQEPDKELFMFVAHELQEALPAAVTGDRGAEKDGEPLYQMVDYSVPMPLVVAMMKVMWDRIKTIEVSSS